MLCLGSAVRGFRNFIPPVNFPGGVNAQLGEDLLHVALGFLKLFYGVLHGFFILRLIIFIHLKTKIQPIISDILLAAFFSHGFCDLPEHAVYCILVLLCQVRRIELQQLLVSRRNRLSVLIA